MSHYKGHMCQRHKEGICNRKKVYFQHKTQFKSKSCGLLSKKERLEHLCGCRDNHHHSTP
eukprot:11148492-Ditylum_brightwellii.AAC.1